MSISLKVLDNTKQIAEYTVVHGQPLQINAQENVNYQLVDNQLGYAPDNILAKREGKNLVIFLDDGDMNADVIIENYYDDEGETTNLVVGLHENGNIYAYVPESGAVPEAISMLAEEMTAPQALGGKALDSAMWAFNPYWLAGLLPFAVAGAIYHYQDKHYGVKTSATPASAPLMVNLNPIKAGDTAITGTVNDPNATVEITLPNGQKITATIDKTNPNPDGTYNFTAPVPTGTPLQANDKVGVNAMSPTETATGEGTVTPNSTPELSVELNPIKAGDTAITGKVNDPNATVEITLPNGQKITATVDKNNPNPDGTYNFTAPVPTGTPLQANDKVGVNAMSPTETATGEGTVTPNSTPELSVELNPIKAGDTAITGKVNDPNATVEITLPNGQKITATVDKNNPNPDGTYNFTAQVPTGTPLQANDKVGVNAMSPTDTATGEGTVTPNSTPELSVELNPIKAGDTAITGKVNDPNATVEITLPNGQKITATVDKNNPNPDGTYNFTAQVPTGTPLQANEKVGVNATSPTETATGEGTVTPNSTPELSVELNPIKAGDTAITGKVNDPNATVEITLPNGQKITATVDKNNPNPDGTYNFTAQVPTGTPLQANDKVGVNAMSPTDTATGEGTVTPNSTPELSVELNPIKAGDTAITGKVNDPNATVEITLPNGQKITATVDKNNPNPDGTYNFTAPVPTGTPLQANEKVGVNATSPTETATGEGTVTPNSTPELSVELNPIKAGDTAITGKVNDPNATVEITLPNGQKITATVDKNNPNPDGTYNFTAQVPTGTPLQANEKVGVNAMSPTETATDEGTVAPTSGENNTPNNKTDLNVAIDPIKEGADKIRGTVDDPNATVELNLPNNTTIQADVSKTPNPDGKSPFVATVPEGVTLKEGDVVTANATNPENNSVSSALTPVQDGTAPTLILDEVKEGAKQITGRVDDPTATVKITLPNGEIIEGKINPVRNEDGTYNFTAEIPPIAPPLKVGEKVSGLAQDPVGNGSNATETVIADVPEEIPVQTDPDTTAPIIVLNPPRSGADQIRGTVDDPTATVMITLPNGRTIQAKVSQTPDVKGKFPFVADVPEDVVLKENEKITANAHDPHNNPALPLNALVLDGTVPTITLDEVKEGTKQITGRVDDPNALVDITLPNGQIIEGKINPTPNEDGTYSFTAELPPSAPPLKAGEKVDGLATDQVGNSSSVSKIVGAGAPIPEIVVTIDPIAENDVINHTEAKGKVVVSGKVVGDIGETTTVNVQVNGKSYPAQVSKVSDSEATYRVEIDGSDFATAESQNVVVTAISTSDLGVQGNATKGREYNVDTRLPSPILTLDKIAEDGVLNQREAGQNVSVSGQIQGEKGKDWNEQTVVNVKIGEDVYPATVQPDGRFSASVPGEKLKEAQTPVVTVTATTTDENGNQGTSQPVNEPYRVNASAPNIVVEIDSVADDDVIGIDEAQEGAKVSIKGTVSGELGNEGALTLVVNIGDTPIPVSADKLEKQADGTITFTLEVDGKTLADNPSRIIRATVSTEDADGNRGSDSVDHPYRTDTNVLNVTIALDKIADDNAINAEEAQRETTLISGRVGGDFLENDPVTLTLQGGQGAPIIETVKVDAQGRFSWNAPTTALRGHNQVNAKIETSRPSGNKADEEAVQTYEFKTDLTTPVIVIESVDDGTINLADVQRTAVPVRGTVTNAKAGDPITLIVNGEPYSGSVGEDGRSFSIDVNGEDLAQADKVSATVTTRDNFGNSATSEPFEKSYKVDLTPPVLNINPLQVGDNSVSGKVTNEAGEPEANVEVELTLGGERDPIRVTTDANGEFTAPITPPLSKDMEVTGRAIDEAGNESAPEREIVTDTRPLDVKITLNNIAGNNVINAGEAGNKIVVSGKVTGEFSEGDIVTITIGNGVERQIPVNANGDFSLELDGSELANATDKFITAATIIANKDGRTGQDSTSRPYRVDTDLPSLNIELDNVTPDGKLSSQEAGGQVTISGTVTGEFANGDRVTLVVDGTRYTGRVNRAGKFSIPVPGNKLLADADHTIQASVSHTDSAGNTGTTSTSKTYGVLADTPEINTHTDFTTPDKAGTVTVTSGLNNNKLVVAYRDESGIVHGVPSTTEGAEKTLTLLKDTSGRWALENGENLPSNVALITTADGRAQLTFQPNALLDGQSITATGSSAGAEENAVNQGVAPTDLRDADDFGWHVYGRETPSHNYRMNRQQQTWQATNNGDLMINGGASNEHLILEYTNNQDQLVTLELKRGTDGLWKDQNGNNVTTTSEGLRRVAQDTAGTQNLFILDGRLVKDGTMVKAWEGSQNGPDLFLSGNNQQNRNDLVWNAESKTFEVKADAQPQKNNSWGYAPTTTLQANITINDITPDNLINATERDQTIPLSGRISGAFRKDDVVELTINGEKYRTTIKDEQGNFDLPVKGSDLAQDSEIEVKVIVTDAHGNSQEINGTHSHRIDLSADKPTITTFPNNGSATVTAGGDNVELTVSWTNTQGQTQNVTLTKGPNGWTGNLPTGVTITDPTQGTVTIDQSLIQDGTPVNATGKDAQGQTANADSRPAGNDAVEAPSINYHANLQNVAGAVERGQVTVTPGNDNDKMVITFTDESNIKHGVASTTTGTQQTLTVVKNAQGRWEVQGNNPDSANIDVNPATGAVTLKPNAVLDGSAVNVVGYNKEATANGVAGNNGATAGTDFAEHQRAITARSDVGWWVIGEEHNGWQPGADGNLLIVPAGNAQNNEHLIIEFTNEQNQAQTVEVTKRADGKWYLGNQEITANSATLKLSNGGFELDGKLVKDGTAVKAWDKSGDPGQDTFISGNNQRGSLADLNPQTLEVLPNAQPNKQNSWAIAPAGYTAQAPSINYHANLQNIPGEVNRGQVTVTPGNDNDKMVITFTDESNIKHGVTSTTTGTQQTLTVVKNAQGRWEVQGNNPDSANIEVNPATGAVTLKPNAVLDGTAVNVVGYNKEATANGVAGNNGATAGVDLAEHQRALAERNDAGWWVIGEEHNGWQPGADGNLLIVPAGGAQNNEHLIIEFTNEQNQAQTVEVTKRADGKWYLGNQEITANSATLKLSNGGFELDGKLVKDGTAVKAWDKSGDPGQDTFISGNNQRGSLADLNPQTLEVLPNAQPNKQNSWAIAPLKISSADQPLVGTNPDGSINVTAGADNTRLKVVYFDETGSKYGAEGATGSTVTFTDATPIEHNGTPAQARVDYTMPTNREVTLNFVKGNNDIWTLEGGNNNLPSGVTINNGVISFSADSVMGNTLMTVTATNSAGVTNTNTGRASVDSHTATRQVWLETVAEMTEASRTPILRDNWATNTRGVNRESLTFNAEDQGGSTKSVPSYVFEYTDRAGVKHTDVFKVGAFNGNDTAWYRTDTFTGEVSDAQIRTSLNKTGTVVNEINGYWTQGDSIAVSADLKNSMQVNSTAYLWSLDSSKGGKWQLQDSWIVPEQVVKKHEVAQFDDPKIDQMVAASNRVNRDIYIENDNDHSGGLTALLEWNNSARSNGQDSEGGRLFNGSHFNFNEALSIFAGFHLQEPRRTEMRTAKLNYTQGNDYLMTTQSIGALNPGSDQQNRIKNMRFNFDDGADMVVAGRDIGTSTATRSGTMTMNMGNGNDIVIAGAGNQEVQLALNNSNGSIDYFFTFNGGVPTATHTPLNKLNDFDGREGGRISGNVVINMDNGDDTLIVEGTRAGGPAGLGEGAAIGEGARINMGAGDDVVMVASYSSLRGNIDNSTVDLGTGNDTISIGGELTGSTRVHGGAGIDTFTYLASSTNNTLDYTKTSGFEIVHLQGGNLNLTWGSVGSAGLEAPLHVSGTGQVTLDGNERAVRQVNEEGITYNVYQNGSQEIYIATGINVI